MIGPAAPPSRAPRYGGGRLSSSRSGFTIIEVMVTIAVLSIGLVAVGSMITYGTIAHSDAQNLTVASSAGGPGNRAHPRRSLRRLQEPH